MARRSLKTRRGHPAPGRQHPHRPSQADRTVLAGPHTHKPAHTAAATAGPTTPTSRQVTPKNTSHLVLRQRWIAVASYGVQHFGATGYETTEECLDDSKNEFVMASAPPRADLGPVAGHRRPGWRMEPE